MEELSAFLKASKARKAQPVQDETLIGNRLHQLFDRMAAQSAMQGRNVLLRTGFAGLDGAIGGLEMGELVAINGVSGSGRTAIALGIALETAKNTQLPILIFSQDHAAQQLTRRILSMLTGVPVCSMEIATLTDDQWVGLATASSWLKDKPIRILEIDRQVPELCDFIRQHNTPALVILDGLSVAAPESEEMQMLKELAVNTASCVVFTDFYHTITPFIAGGVDKVLDLECYSETECVLRVLWNRNGQRDYTSLTWHKDTLQFFDPTEE